MPTWAIIFFILAGVFSLAGGVFNWEWFMTNRRAAIFVDLIGRTGARVFYAIIGVFLAALGFAGAFGLI